MNYVIKDYEEEMLAELIDLFYETVHTVCIGDYNEDQLERWAPKQADLVSWKQRLANNLCKVAFINSVLVGFAELTSDGHVDTMYVHKDFQHRGIAGALLNELQHIAAENEFRTLTTEASITAKPFFEKYGFEITRVKTKLYNGKEFINYEMKKHTI